MLERIVRLLEWTTDYIRYTTAPLNEVLREAARVSEFERLLFLQQLPADLSRHTVCEAVTEKSNAMMLADADVRLLCEIIEGWGMADLSGEIHRCRQYTARFEKQYRAACEDAERRGRLYITLGICGGSALALVLGG